MATAQSVFDWWCRQSRSSVLLEHYNWAPLNKPSGRHRTRKTRRRRLKLKHSSIQPYPCSGRAASSSKLEPLIPSLLFHRAGSPVTKHRRWYLALAIAVVTQIPLSCLCKLFVSRPSHAPCYQPKSLLLTSLRQHIWMRRVLMSDFHAFIQTIGAPNGRITISSKDVFSDRFYAYKPIHESRSGGPYSRSGTKPVRGPYPNIERIIYRLQFVGGGGSCRSRAGIILM